MCVCVAHAYLLDEPVEEGSCGDDLVHVEEGVHLVHDRLLLQFGRLDSRGHRLSLGSREHRMCVFGECARECV